jgi:hypothetical protein
LSDPSSDSAKPLNKEKYLKLMDEHYNKAKDTIWSSWKDSEMRDWLVSHGHLKSEAKTKRDDVRDSKCHR